MNDFYNDNADALPGDSRIHQYLDNENQHDIKMAYEGWKNTVILIFIFIFDGKMINITPFLDTQCRKMFDSGVKPQSAVIWIAKYFNMVNPYVPQENDE